MAGPAAAAKRERLRMIRYLLDTNIISEPTKHKPDEAVIAKLDEYADEISIAAPVLHELRYGIDRMAAGRKRDRVEQYVREAVEARLPALPYDAAAAVQHASQRARLEARGATPSFVDGQIAAIAIVHGLTLVTRNVTDFNDFTPLRVENWFEE